MGCYESIKEPDPTSSGQDHLIPYKSRLRNPFIDMNDTSSLYWRLVRDYTGRDMSFASDSLHAFSAFAAEFERAGYKLSWGLPICNSSLHLLWEHEPWDFRDITRRTEFPSWSWAGWCGTAAMNFPLGMGSESIYICTVNDKSPHGRVLNCDVRGAKVKISGQFPLLGIAEALGSSIVLDGGFSSIPEFVSGDFTLMEVCRVKDFVHGLLVKPHNEDFERIGSGFMKVSDFEAARPDRRILKLA